MLLSVNLQTNVIRLKTKALQAGWLRVDPLKTQCTRHHWLFSKAQLLRSLRLPWMSKLTGGRPSPSATLLKPRLYAIWIKSFLENACKSSLTHLNSIRNDIEGMAAYKRIKEFAAKQYEFMPKVLSPAIFNKALQLPPLLTTLSGDSTALKSATNQNAVASHSRHAARSRAG